MRTLILCALLLAGCGGPEWRVLHEIDDKSPSQASPVPVDKSRHYKIPLVDVPLTWKVRCTTPGAGPGGHVVILVVSRGDVGGAELVNTDVTGEKEWEFKDDGTAEHKISVIVSADGPFKLQVLGFK